MTKTTTEIFPRSSFRRRFGSWIYDFLIAFAVWMLAGTISFILMYMAHYFGLFSLQGYSHFSDTVANTFWLKWPNEFWKVAWVCYFFVYFWNKSGQTLGMKAWRLRVQNRDGSLINKKSALKRLLPTLLGLGNILVIFDRKNRLSLQDRVTDTEVVVLSLEANRGRL